GPLFRQETGVLPVPLPVLDVQLTVRDVHVPADDGAATLVFQLTQPRGHLVQERVLEVHRGGAGGAGVDVGAHHGQRGAGQVQVGVDPAADLVVGAAGLGSDADADGLQWQPGGDRHPGAPLGGALLVHQVPVGVEEAAQDVVVGADLLQQDDLGLLLGDPVLHTAAEGGPAAVDIDGGDAEHASLLPQ